MTQIEALKRIAEIYLYVPWSIVQPYLHKEHQEELLRLYRSVPTYKETQ